MKDKDTEAQRQQVRHLLVLEDTEGRRPILLEAATYSIGRDSTNSIVLHSKLVSRQHSLLLRVTNPDSGSYIFRIVDGDLQGKRSTNGILVNGQRCFSHDLKHGDTIVWGGDVRARYLTLTNMSDGEFAEFCEGTDVLGFLSKSSNPFATLVPVDNQDIAEFSEAALVRLASYPELTPNPILEIDLQGTITYLNPAAVMQFNDLQRNGVRHPILLGLPEMARYMKQTEEKVHVREVEYDQRIYEQSIHYIYESELIRSYITDVTERKRAEEQLRHQARREAVINRIIQAMRTTMIADEVLQITADLLLEALGANCCLITQSKNQTTTVASHPPLTEIERQMGQLNNLALSIYQDSLVMGNQVLLLVNSEKLPNSIASQFQAFHLDVMVVTPLIYVNKFLGNITLFQSSLDRNEEHEEYEMTILNPSHSDPIFHPSGITDANHANSNHWTLDELSLVKTIADQCALAIHQAHLYQQVQELNADLECQVQARTAELEQKMQELERLNALKDDFLSTVSHELRTPMANIKMAIHMLKQFPLEQRQERYLIILSNECNRETELINDLLDLQRLEAGRTPIQQEIIDLNSWLPLVVEPFRNRMQQRNQTLHVHRPDRLPQIESNRHALERILAELLNNACKYTPAAGQIVLNVLMSSDGSVSPDHPRAIAGDYIQFQVINPSEIPANELPRIFEKFYRVPNADPWHQGGTGLGLALTKKLVEQLRGEIAANSNEGITSFTLTLPLVTSQD